ncbi:SDR family oxidoreductase [Pedobacter gandavensis]|uniref:dTDP-4-dehydrorhamnose reductase family protein n=1 Tax=Pedobacter gandavensis TaxID=2679963 RepID=UPI00292DB4E8|nr:SDR family oxidoreductase [Pedobacter gandavensis]
MEQVKKIVLVGSKGMAGHILYTYFRENTGFEIVDLARDAKFHTPKYQLDVTDFSNLSEILQVEKPAFVINCIGLLNKNAEDNPDKAILLNSYLPHFLAKKGDEMGFKLIHISTDCVFSGKKGNYRENSEKDGTGFYAKSKALGEVDYHNHLTLRTSIIGPELNDGGIGLFHWFMNQKGIIKGYTKAFWTGVTTIELSMAIKAAIDQNISGIHHLVNGEKINKHDLLILFKEIFKKDDVEIDIDDKYEIDKSLIKTNFDFDYVVPTYEVMIKEMKEWVDSHQDLYPYNL